MKNMYKNFVLGGKSSVLMDVKPWDDETDMKKLEEAVRSVELPGLLWGACMICFLSLNKVNFINESYTICETTNGFVTVV